MSFKLKCEAWMWLCCKAIMSLFQKYPTADAVGCCEILWWLNIHIQFRRVTSASESDSSNPAPSGLRKCRGSAASDHLGLRLLLRRTAWIYFFFHWNKCPHNSSSRLDCSSALILKGFKSEESDQLPLQWDWQQHNHPILVTASQFYLR